MAEHQEYCGAVLRELRPRGGPWLQDSGAQGYAGMGEVQNVIDGESADSGTTDLSETVATVQRVQ